MNGEAIEDASSINGVRTGNELIILRIEDVAFGIYNTNPLDLCSMCLPWEQRVELGMSLDLMGNRSRCEIVSDLAYRAIPNIDPKPTPLVVIRVQRQRPTYVGMKDGSVSADQGHVQPVIMSRPVRLAEIAPILSAIDANQKISRKLKSRNISRMKRAYER